MNYFQLFDLAEQFSIDNQHLSECYQSLQKKVHPDRFAHRSAQEQLLAVQKSAYINDGYQTLKKPLPRAEYLLSLRDIKLAGEQRSFSDTHFLMHQMELREMLAEVVSATDSEHEITRLNQTVDQEYQQLFSQLSLALDKNTLESNTLACDNIHKLKFYQKLQLEIEQLEDKLFE